MHGMYVERKLKYYRFLDPLNIHFQGNAVNTINMYIQISLLVRIKIITWDRFSMCKYHYNKKHI